MRVVLNLCICIINPAYVNADAGLIAHLPLEHF